MRMPSNGEVERPVDVKRETAVPFACDVSASAAYPAPLSAGRWLRPASVDARCTHSPASPPPSESIAIAI